MIWTDAPCQVTCWNDGNLTAKAYQDPSIECIVAQHPWLENDCYFADIIFPVVTKHEMHDIGNDMSRAIHLVYPSSLLSAGRLRALSDLSLAKVAEKSARNTTTTYTTTWTKQTRVRFFYKGARCARTA
jgi:trimethylamine-N-oxide reductase (cytochrome c)